MKLSLKLLLSIVFFTLMSSNVSFAQDSPNPDSSSVAVEESADQTQSSATDASQDVEQPAKRSFWSKLAFWKKAPKPKAKVNFNVEVEDVWHENIARYMGVTDEEFYRFGYARKGLQWYPILFLRRFEMIPNQYNHTLIIRGRPEKIPKVKGITLGLYGMEVVNEGFEFQMPTVASVSRSQKKYDDIQALDVATNRIQTFGFDQVVWLRDKKRVTKDIADTWAIPIPKTSESNKH